MSGRSKSESPLRAARESSEVEYLSRLLQEKTRIILE